MRAIIERFGGAAIVRLSGILAEGPNHRQEALWDLVDGLARGGARLIVLNLRALTAVDAMGLGEIAEAYRRARLRGVKLTLVAPPPRVERLLSITRLRTVIEVCETEGQALGRLRPAPMAPAYQLAAMR